MKHAMVSLVLLTVLFGAGAGPLHAGAVGERTEEIVAVVNGVGIPRSYWDREVVRFEDLLRRQGQTLDEERMEEVEGQALDTLVNMELLYQESRRRSLEVSEEQVAEQVGSLRERFPSEEAFAAALQQMGFTVAELEVELGRQSAVQLLIDTHIAPGISVSEEELRSYYADHPEVFRSPAQVRARHILIRVEADASPEVEARAQGRIEEIRRRIVGGADFGELARELSEDGSRTQGGDLGYFSRDRMVPAFSEAAFSLPLGTLSEPVRTQFGFHLIEVTDRKEEGVLAYGEIEPELRDYLRHERTMSALDGLVAELRRTASIEKHPGRAPAD